MSTSRGAMRDSLAKVSPSEARAARVVEDALTRLAQRHETKVHRVSVTATGTSATVSIPLDARSGRTYLVFPGSTAAAGIRLTGYTEEVFPGESVTVFIQAAAGMTNPDIILLEV